MNRAARTAATLAALVPGAAVLTAAAWVRLESRGRVTDVARAPAAPWVVVLGAGVTDAGTPSNTLSYRLDRTVELVRAGRAARVLVTGGSAPQRDEVAAMTAYLVARGIPRADITVDGWGNNTFNSAQRARNVFGVERALVVTQRFHIHRAVALFRRAGVDAHGVADEEGRRERTTWAVGTVRELAGNVKALTDTLTGRAYLSPETTPPGAPEGETHKEASA